MTKIFIFVPGFGQIVSAATFMTSHAIAQHLYAKQIGYSLSTLSFPDIAELRGIATTIWYDTMPDCQYMLFIDSDMGFPPELVTDMMWYDFAHNRPLLGTIYRQRREPVSWAGSGTGTTMTQRQGDFMLVEGVGFGCTLIRRDVMTALIARFPNLVDTRIELYPARGLLEQAGAKRLIRSFEKLDIPGRGIVSEDLSFCIRAGHCGIQTWANIKHPISHVGPYDYKGSYLDALEEAEAKKTAEADAKAKGDPPPSVATPPIWLPPNAERIRAGMNGGLTAPAESA
jgi:hypothetical protein